MHLIARRTLRARRGQRGTSMIEVLVSIVIVVLGLLGLAGLQTQASLSEMESFQRAQAVVLLQDMVDRLNANRFNAMSYVTVDPVGTGSAVQDCSVLADHQRDLCEWSNALLGAAESSGGTQVGAMIGARGCVTAIQPNMPREFEIAIVWQGINSTKEPGTACGAGQYGADERKRRAVTARVIIGCLQNNPATGLCMFPL